jgi:hypothetical protein
MSAGQKWAFGLLSVGLVSAVVFVALTLLDGCTPAEAQNREGEALQAAGLAGCITEAKSMDASHDERFAAYTVCARMVDADAGRK